MKRMNKLNKREKKLTYEEREACSGRGYVVSEKYLGGGAAGKVFLAEPKAKKIQQNSRLTFLAKSNRKLQVAVKIVPVDLGCYYVRKLSKYLSAEVANMNAVFGEPNILKLLDVFIECKRIFLVLEYASRGSLKTYFHRKVSQEGRSEGGKWMDESEARFIFRQMVLGLHALHTCNIAHRDLKLENVLLMENGDVKLCDFGFSVKQPALDSNEQNVKFAFREMRSVTTCGTPAFMAPEILNCRGGYNAMHGDLWSMGVVLFTLVNGRYPFPGKTFEEVTRQYEMTKARSMKFRNGVSEGACDLIKRLLNRNPSKRLRTCEILQHPWLSETTNDLTSANLSISVEDCIQAKNDPIFRFQEKVVRSYLLQRADLLDSCKESLSRHHVAASVQAQFGVAIPLHNPDGRPVNEIWRLCARQTDGDDKISDDIDEGDEPGCGATNLRCEWLKPGSCSTEDLKRVVTGLPLTNAWRRVRAKTNYYPRTEIEKCLTLFNTVHLSDSPKRARRVWVKANGRGGTSLPHHHRPIFVNGVRMMLVETASEEPDISLDRVLALHESRRRDDDDEGSSPNTTGVGGDNTRASSENEEAMTSSSDPLHISGEKPSAVGKCDEKENTYPTLAAGDGYFTNITGADRCFTNITGADGYFTNITGADGCFTNITAADGAHEDIVHLNVILDECDLRPRKVDLTNKVPTYARQPGRYREPTGPKSSPQNADIALSTNKSDLELVNYTAEICNLPDARNCTILNGIAPETLSEEYKAAAQQDAGLEKDVSAGKSSAVGMRPVNVVEQDAADIHPSDLTLNMERIGVDQLVTNTAESVDRSPVSGTPRSDVSNIFGPNLSEMRECLLELSSIIVSQPPSSSSSAICLHVSNNMVNATGSGVNKTENMPEVVPRTPLLTPAEHAEFNRESVAYPVIESCRSPQPLMKDVVINEAELEGRLPQAQLRSIAQAREIESFTQDRDRTSQAREIDSEQESVSSAQMKVNEISQNEHNTLQARIDSTVYNEVKEINSAADFQRLNLNRYREPDQDVGFVDPKYYGNTSENKRMSALSSFADLKYYQSCVENHKAQFSTDADVAIPQINNDVGKDSLNNYTSFRKDVRQKSGTRVEQVTSRELGQGERPNFNYDSDFQPPQQLKINSLHSGDSSLVRTVDMMLLAPGDKELSSYDRPENNTVLSSRRTAFLSSYDKKVEKFLRVGREAKPFSPGAGGDADFSFPHSDCNLFFSMGKLNNLEREFWRQKEKEAFSKFLQTFKQTSKNDLPDGNIESLTKDFPERAEEQVWNSSRYHKLASTKSPSELDSVLAADRESLDSTIEEMVFRSCVNKSTSTKACLQSNVTSDYDTKPMSELKHQDRNESKTKGTNSNQVAVVLDNMALPQLNEVEQDLDSTSIFQTARSTNTDMSRASENDSNQYTSLDHWIRANKIFRELEMIVGNSIDNGKAWCQSLEALEGRLDRLSDDVSRMQRFHGDFKTSHEKNVERDGGGGGDAKTGRFNRTTGWSCPETGHEMTPPTSLRKSRSLTMETDRLHGERAETRSNKPERSITKTPMRRNRKNNRQGFRNVTRRYLI